MNNAGEGVVSNAGSDGFRQRMGVGVLFTLPMYIVDILYVFCDDSLMDATDLLYRYWLNDVVASRAAWDPMVDLEAAVENADYQVVKNRIGSLYFR